MTRSVLVFDTANEQVVVQLAKRVVNALDSCTLDAQSLEADDRGALHEEVGERNVVGKDLLVDLLEVEL